MLSIELHPEAEFELEDAEAYYEQIYPELRLQFRKEIEFFSKHISQHPESAMRYSDTIRRAVLQQFPYSIYYEVTPSRVLFYAIGHNSQRPHYWKSRSFG